jgi:small subunit ribosomal protein S5
MSPAAKVRLVFIKRSARTAKGGRRFSFSALAVVGDSSGRVGLGLGKSTEVANAIMKAEESAVAQMVHVSLKAGTIPHEVCGIFCGAKVWLRPASPGTGIIASRTVRTVLECAGVKDVVTKSLGTHNAANVAKATLQALLGLRLQEDVYEGRGLKAERAKRPVILRFPNLGTGKDRQGLN